MLYIQVIMLFTLGTLQVFSQEKPYSFGVIFDQDFLLDVYKLGGNKDQNYTMGVGFYLSKPKWAASKLFTPIAKLSKPPTGSNDSTATITLGVTGFTPLFLKNEMDSTSLFKQFNDRPFSSLLFLSFRYSKMSKRKAVTDQFILGVLGLNIAREVQTEIHKRNLFGSTRDIPTGWENQISEGGEPTALYAHKLDWLLTKKHLKVEEIYRKKFRGQFIGSGEYRLGYYIGLNGGISFRLGNIDPRNWINYDINNLTYSNQIVSLKKHSGEGYRNEFYFQAGIRPHLVIYNALLMGQFKKDNFHELSFKEIENIVVEGNAGVGFTFVNCKRKFAFNILLNVSGRSPEFELALPRRNHYWGGLHLNIVSN